MNGERCKVGRIGGKDLVRHGIAIGRPRVIGWQNHGGITKVTRLAVIEGNFHVKVVGAGFSRTKGSGSDGTVKVRAVGGGKGGNDVGVVPIFNQCLIGRRQGFTAIVVIKRALVDTHPRWGEADAHVGCIVGHRDGALVPDRGGSVTGTVHQLGREEDKGGGGDDDVEGSVGVTRIVKRKMD